MAILYADANGNLLGYARDVFENAILFPSPPAGTTFTITFDETTNSSLVADIPINRNLYTAPAGTLTKQGVGAVVISAPSADFLIESAILTGFSDSQIRSAINLLWNGTATTLQEQKAIAYIAFVLHQKGIL